MCTLVLDILSVKVFIVLWVKLVDLIYYDFFFSVKLFWRFQYSNKKTWRMGMLIYCASEFDQTLTLLPIPTSLFSLKHSEWPTFLIFSGNSRNGSTVPEVPKLRFIFLEKKNHLRKKR